MEILITVILAAGIAELTGYLMHILLHSNKIAFLSKSHMIHHLVLYGPKMQMRSKIYKSPLLDNRIGFMGIGLEWWIPTLLMLLFYIGIFLYFGISWHLLVIFLAVVTIWGLFFYNYMHDAMHIEEFWMIKNRVLNKWFLNARHLHDIHHIQISDDGRMNKNYGICFFAFDKIFGTFQGQFKEFNENGYQNAKKRYSYINEHLEGKEHTWENIEKQKAKK